MTSPLFVVRRATPSDVPVIARHRAEMFRDMGQLPADLYPSLMSAVTQYLDGAIPQGEYIGWLASPACEPLTIVAGAGVQRRRGLARPRDSPAGAALSRGNEAIVLNVFTERAWRRQGLARLLMEQVFAWAREVSLDSLVLHASSDGRRLYESLGFVQTNEMRFRGDLRGGD